MVAEASCALPRAEARDKPRKKTVVLVSRETGTLWFAGWLFTIGFADLGFWKGVLALIAWPYYLGRLAAGW